VGGGEGGQIRTPEKGGRAHLEKKRGRIYPEKTTRMGKRGAWGGREGPFRRGGGAPERERKMQLKTNNPNYPLREGDAQGPRKTRVEKGGGTAKRRNPVKKKGNSREGAKPCRCLWWGRSVPRSGYSHTQQKKRKRILRKK